MFSSYPTQNQFDKIDEIMEGNKIGLESEFVRYLVKMEVKNFQICVLLENLSMLKDSNRKKLIVISATIFFKLLTFVERLNSHMERKKKNSEKEDPELRLGYMIAILILILEREKISLRTRHFKRILDISLDEINLISNIHNLEIRKNLRGNFFLNLENLKPIENAQLRICMKNLLEIYDKSLLEDGALISYIDDIG